MSQACSISTGKIYGLQRVCRAWNIARSTVYEHRKRRKWPCLFNRRGPKGPCCDAELAENIREVLVESPFHGEGYRKVWAKLRYKGIRTSKERTRRVMRENNLLAPQRAGNRHGSKAHDGTIVTDTPNEVWGTDMTTTVTVKEGKAAVFVAVDHFNAECVGIHASKSQTRFEALEPIRQGVREYYGGFADDIAEGLKIRHDHGSQYMADEFQDEIGFLGMISSPSFVREPEGNGCAERFIRTLKENLLWVRTFDTVEELRLSVLEFKKNYNEKWIIQRMKYQTPLQARRNACNNPKKAA
jgi:transposase InsO family protein